MASAAGGHNVRARQTWRDWIHPYVIHNSSTLTDVVRLLDPYWSGRLWGWRSLGFPSWSATDCWVGSPPSPPAPEALYLTTYWSLSLNKRLVTRVLCPIIILHTWHNIIQQSKSFPTPLWANQLIHWFLVGQLRSCLQGTNGRVVSPQPCYHYRLQCKKIQDVVIVLLGFCGLYPTEGMWVLFGSFCHVLQPLLIRFTRQNSGCVSVSMMEHLRKRNGLRIEAPFKVIRSACWLVC